jgi:hypothetical protein
MWIVMRKEEIARGIEAHSRLLNSRVLNKPQQELDAPTR